MASDDLTVANKFQVGPTSLASGLYTMPLRAAEDGGLVIGDGHGRFAELAARNQVYAAFNALTGLAVAGGHVAPPAAGAATFLTVGNPIGSGVNLEILQGILSLEAAATTYGAGFWAWCGNYQGGSWITVAESGATKRPLFVGQAVTRALAWGGATLTGSVLQPTVRPFPLCTFAAIDSAIDQRVMVDNVDGGLVVPPGCIVTLAPAAAGTGVTASGCIIWAEVPLPQGAAGESLG